MKRVIIIEDNEDDFEKIKSTFCFDFPNDKLNINNWGHWKYHLENALIQRHTEKGVHENSRRWLIKKIKTFYDVEDEVVFLVDFFLKGEKYDTNVNGINFFKLFIDKELFPSLHIPVCFITNATGEDNNRVTDYVREINDRSIRDFLNKFENYSESDNFKNQIIEFIKRSHSIVKKNSIWEDLIKRKTKNVVYDCTVDGNLKNKYIISMNEVPSNPKLQTVAIKNAIEGFFLFNKYNLQNIIKVLEKAKNE